MSQAVSDSSTVRVEVYQFPEDCVFDELKAHFEDEPFFAKCLTSEEQAYNERTKTYTLEFSTKDAVKVLSSARQLLDRDDETSVISLRPSIKKALIISEQKPISQRFLKKTVRKYGDIEDCTTLDASHYVVTFANAQDAASLASARSITIGESLKVQVQLYDQFDPTMSELLKQPRKPPAAQGHSSAGASNVVAPTGNSQRAASKRNSTYPDFPVQSKKSSPVPESQTPSRPISYYWKEYKNRIDAFPQHPTHIEVDILKNETAITMHTLLLLHLEKFHADLSASFHQSYDAHRGLFRFDLNEKDIEQLIASEEPLIDEDETSVLSIRPVSTGKVVLLKIIKNKNKAKLDAKDLHAHFGQQSKFSMPITVSYLQDDGAFLELETSSVASLLVSTSPHILSNELVLEASFPLIKASLSAAKSSLPAATASSSSGELPFSHYTPLSADKETGLHNQKKEHVLPESKKHIDNLHGESTFAGHTQSSSSEDATFSADVSTNRGVVQRESSAWPGKARRIARTDSSSSSSLHSELIVEKSGQPARAFLVSNIIDFDEQTLYYWFKSAFHIWPVSIQVSFNEEQAVVKIPGNSLLADDTIEKIAASSDYMLHGERMKVKEIPLATSIQVLSSNDKEDDMIDHSTLELYFSNARHTGIEKTTSKFDIIRKGFLCNLPAHVITYDSSQDVQSVISNSPHNFGKWSFKIAEFYPELDVSGTGCLSIYKDNSLLQAEAPVHPVIRILDVDKDLDTETLEMFMSDRKRTNGGEISFWKVEGDNINVVYKEPKVAERVYQSYTNQGLICSGKHLKLELDIPWLTELHDDHKLRISGLPGDIDPEKLKFYLSAVSSNFVSQLFFDETQQRAVAIFKNALDYGKFITLHHSLPLQELPNMKVSQEFACRELLAYGKLSKEGIELSLEKLLSQNFNKEVEVLAEELPGTSDIWKVTAEVEAVRVILKSKHCIPRCDHLVPYSSFLGLHVTSGVYKKSASLHDFLADQMVLKFLLEHPVGYGMVSQYFQSLGMVLKGDGLVTIDVAISNSNNRRALRNWRSLRLSLGKFVQEKLSSFTTDPLTYQIYDSISRKLPALTADQPVVYAATASGENGSFSNSITFLGEKQSVVKLKDQLLTAITELEAAIQEESMVKDVRVPNIPEYQIKYFQDYHFFEKLCQNYKLKGISVDPSKKTVIMRGVPSNVQSAQKVLLSMLPVIEQSRVSMNKKRTFVAVINTEFARKAIHQELLLKKLEAVWTLENKTVSVYSDSGSTSQAALDSINDVIWEAMYPADGLFDELERQLLTSDQWRDKKEHLQSVYQPLVISELTDRSRLVAVGLSHHKAIVLEELPMFFNINVKRTEDFSCNPHKITFLWDFQADIVAQLKKTCNVDITKTEGDSLAVTGIKDDIAKCKRSLEQHIDAICKDTHIVEHQSMIHHIKENPDFIKQAGLQSGCLVVHHCNEGSFENPKSNNSNRFSVTLPNSGVTCTVKKDDITTLRVDAIVNAANSNLEHVGGLALAIVQQGGQGIQQECCNHIRKDGPLMEGQVFTSSAGNLKCKKIIHAVGPRWRQGQSNEEQTLYNCVDNCFDEVERYNLRSIAIPPISTGIFGYPIHKAVPTIVEVVRERDKKGQFLPQNIIFVDNKENTLKLFEKELATEYNTSKHHTKVSPEPLVKQNSTSATAARGYFTVKNHVMTVANRVSIEVVHGDVSKSQVDCLVNSVGPQLNLSSGQVSTIIASLAGPQLQAACSTFAPLAIGNVVQTPGFNMQCRTILHCVCPPWKNKKTVKILKSVVMRCLELASIGPSRSIAFPALGTGNLKYPEKEVAKAMLEAAVEYFTKIDVTSSVTDVKIVIYHLDRGTQRAFDDELKILAGTVQPTRDIQPKGTTRASENAIKLSAEIDGTTVRLLQGDIAAHYADILVNSTDAALNMNGQVSEALLARAGIEVQQEVLNLSTTPSQNGMWISKAGDLQAKLIFHVDGSSVAWSQLVYSCLLTAELYNLHSIAFPALGTGQIGEDSHAMAKTMLKAVSRYIEDNPGTKLTNFDIVILRGDILNDFHKTMKKYLSSSSLVKKLQVKVVDIVSSLIFGKVDDEPVSVPRKFKFDASHLNSEEDLLKLDIYGKSSADIARCKKELETKIDKAIITLIWSSKPSYTDDRDNIPKLSTSQLETLKVKSAELKVSLEIDQILCNIKICGLSQNVLAMTDHVALELKKIEKLVQEKKEEALIAKTVQWMYEDIGGNWIDFHLSTNKALEEAYAVTPSGKHSYEGNNGHVTLYLDKMIGVESGSRFNIRRKDLRQSQGVMTLPTTWQAPVDTYQEFLLAPNTQEYQDVENAFMKTLGAGGNALMMVTRVQNPTLYQQYAILRNAAAKRLGIQENQVEKYLWHGTDEVTARKITSGKFDRIFSGRHAVMYGCGSYFATTSAYSARYAAPNAQGEKFMILTQVITGDCCQGNKDLMTAPYKSNSNEQYDSVVDDVNNPTIFVVFNDTSAYPCYILKFQ